MWTRIGLMLAGAVLLTVTFQNCSDSFQAIGADDASSLSTPDEVLQGEPELPIIKSCSFNGVEIPEGGQVESYSASTVPYGQSCENYKATNICLGGEMSERAHVFATCMVDAPAACLHSGITIQSGDSITRYLASSVPVNDTCKTVNISCQNGTLSSDPVTYPQCVVQQPIYRWVNSQDGEQQGQTCHRVGLYAAQNQGYGTCASGERRPQAGDDHLAINYRYGSWGSPSVGGTQVIMVSSVRSFCYTSDQKQDGDKTDELVAFLCTNKAP